MRTRARSCGSRANGTNARAKNWRKARIGEKKVNGTADMKAILGCTAFALAIALATIPADARGCIKGAIVGGVAGHLAGHHGVLGAAAGCAIGHHEAKRREKALQSPQ